MKPAPYICVSGYHRSPENQFKPDPFFKIWSENICKATPPPDQIIIIADSGARPPVFDHQWPVTLPLTVIHLKGDLGNCHALLNGVKPHKFSGWTGVVLAGAMLAYTNETDFVFWEEDALCFGDVIGKMYEEIGDAGIIFGNCGFMPAAQSLFLVRHAYIPEFVRLFLSQESQQLKENLGEEIFLRLQREYPDKWKRFSFGYDRTRPINYDDPIFYGQHWTPEELDELKRRGLV